MVVDLVAPAVVRPTLPLPSRERWEPLRAGIIGVWQYPDQEFVFYRGRLVLQGLNGAGKTKVLELLFPFVLDARNEAHRLSPGGGDGRTWRWNLLEIGKDGEPVRKRANGIVWLEFGRRGHAGSMEFCTIGARLQASMGSPRVGIAYFITDQRPGEDIAFLAMGEDGARTPISRDRLEEIIGDRGHVFDQRLSYRNAVDERLFGLRGRFDGLMNLLISLRQPKLSEKLDLERLVGHLRDALPPVNDDQVRQLADALDSLRDDEQGLDRMKRARGAVAHFLDDYRDYALRETRSVADKVRGAEEGVRQASDRQRAAKDAAEKAEADVTRLSDDIETATQEIAAVSGKIEAHRKSPEMMGADRLEQAETAAGNAKNHADDLATAASNLEDEATEAAAKLEEAENEVTEVTTQLETHGLAAKAASETASMVPAQEQFDESRATDLEAAAKAVQIAVTARRRALGERAEESRALAKLRTRRDDAQTAAAESDSAYTDAEKRRDRAAEVVAEVRDRLEDALLTWAADLVELVADEEAIARVVEAVDEGQRVADAVVPLATNVRAAIATAEGRIAHEDERLQTQAERLHLEREALLATTIARPMPTPARPADRTDRPGAPFYEVVDFAASLEASRAAGFEAALEASGILDAWVLPDGGLLPAEEHDAAIVTGPSLDGVTLADVLVAAGDRVSAPMVARLLRSIGLGERMDGPWVDVDGRYALGPLIGRFAKAEAGYIGAGAQAATRARRIAEIDGTIAEVGSRRDALTKSRAGLADRTTAVDSELTSAPSDVDLVAAQRELVTRTAELDAAATAKTTAEGRAAALRRDEVEKATALADSLVALGLPPGTTDVTPAQTALTEYQTSILALTSEARAWIRAVRLRDGAGKTHDRIAKGAGDARERANAQALEATRLAAEAVELRRAHGATAEAAIARLRELQGEQGRLGTRLSKARDDLLDARDRRGETRQKLTDAQGRVNDAEGRRTEAAHAFGRFAATPLFALATDWLVEGDPRAWSVRAVVETARRAVATEDRASFEPAARNTASKNVYTRFGELQSEIGTEFAISIDPTTDDNLLLVDAQYGDERVPIGWLSNFLERTIAEQEAQLDARSRDILSRYLFEGIGEELGDRIREARTLIERMNAELARCPTASGLRIHLRWELGPDVPDGANRATDLLLLPTVTLHENDRKTIVSFLQARVTEARELEESKGFSDALIEALDYRSWFAFTIEEIGPTGRHHRITSRDYAAGSGGEKAVTLHLPLFAAVAAYYTGEASKSPRLFFLDEAFAGIDRPMRGSMMGFIVRFDLDFVFTTPDDLCTYAELDGTATYQLYRDPHERGVYAQRWVWTGAELLDEEALRALDEAAG